MTSAATTAIRIDRPTATATGMVMRSTFSGGTSAAVTSTLTARLRTGTRTVVGAGLESGNTRVLVPERRQHQDGHVIPSLQIRAVA